MRYGGKMKALVTGGAGFIGSNLVDELLSLGYEVVVIDNESAVANEKFYWNSKAKNYKYDICDYNLTKDLYKDVDYVFHLAAQARIQRTINEPLETIRVNSLGTATVLECSRQAKVKRVIYSSTSSAYGKNLVPNIESQPNDCLNPYSVSKVSGEEICSIYTKVYGLETLTLRYFNVYGERQPIKGEYAPVIGKFQKQKESLIPLTIVGDGKQKRDFTYVKDIVKANILAATKDIDKKYFGQIFNIGSGKNYSINEIAKIINFQSIYIESRPGESQETLSNIEKAKLVIGWEPTVSLQEWIKKNNS
jgi:UDP-glucose 4-epimerase